MGHRLLVRPRAGVDGRQSLRVGAFQHLRRYDAHGAVPFCMEEDLRCWSRRAVKYDGGRNT